MSEVVAIESQPGIGPVLRIMRDASYDPFATPSGDFGKMRFDSRAGSKLSHVGAIETIGYNGAYTGDKVDYFLPSGRTISNFWTYCNANIDGISHVQTQIWSVGASYGDYGYYPLIEGRRTTDGVTFTGPSLKYQIQGQTPGPIVREWGVMYGASGYDSYSNSTLIIANGAAQNVENTPIGGLVGAGNATRYVTTVFQLPARNVARPDYSGTPIVGQVAIEISNAMARVALPGRDVTSSNINHFIVHENRIPAKILAAGDVQIDAGSSATIYPRLGPITADSYLDYHIARVGEPMSHPPRPAGWLKTNPLSLVYTVYTDRVVVTNNGTDSFVMRYLLMAPSNVAKTSGGVEVFRRGNDGVGDYFQIKAPGSSDTSPSFGDILLDTRFSYVPIIAEGFLNWGTTDFPNTSSDPSYGELYRSITFANNGGFKPMVKASVVFPSQWFSGYHEVFVGNDGALSTWYGRCTARSYHATIYDNQVDLYMAGGNPLRFAFDRSVVFPPSPALGLRYYILAIPV